MKKRNSGFTLVELLITISIIGIVAVVAWPTFERYQYKISHSDAVAGVMLAANVMEKCGSMAGGVYTDCHVNAGYPLPSPDGKYNITIEVGPPDDMSYMISASRVSEAAGERCGDFTLDNLGRKGMAEFNNITGTVQECWQQ